MIARFPDQLEEALAIGRAAQLARPDRIDHVFVSGLGGSGIGGRFVAEFIRDTCPVPFVVGHAYDIPAWVGPGTLAIASSYSGNTEETLEAMRRMLASGASVVVVSSGGQLQQMAEQAGAGAILLPDNWSSPRACLGYSLVQQLVILERFGLVPARLLTDLADAATLLKNEMADIRERAATIAEMLHQKTTVIYTTDRMEAVAIRFRQQLNENAKVLCWHHVVPEMNHNELVGWRDRRDDLAVLVFRNHDDLPRNQTRLALTREVVSHYTGSYIETYAKGQSQIAQALYHVHLGDWISWYLAGLRGVDAVEVRVIDFLKSALAEEPQ